MELNLTLTLDFLSFLMFRALPGYFRSRQGPKVVDRVSLNLQHVTLTRCCAPECSFPGSTSSFWFPSPPLCSAVMTVQLKITTTHFVFMSIVEHPECVSECRVQLHSTANNQFMRAVSRGAQEKTLQMRAKKKKLMEQRTEVSSPERYRPGTVQRQKYNNDRN